MKNENTFTTKDFYQACVIRAFGLSLQEISYFNNNFATFIFNDPNENGELIVKSYWDRKLQIDARTLIDSINELKTRLHSKT